MDWGDIKNDKVIFRSGIVKKKSNSSFNIDEIPEKLVVAMVNAVANNG